MQFSCFFARDFSIFSYIFEYKYHQQHMNEIQKHDEVILFEHFQFNLICY